MFISNPDVSHGFTWTHGTVKKLLNNGRSALSQGKIKIIGLPMLQVARN